jgi:hypothetical protein
LQVSFLTVWAVWDFTLEQKLDGHDITEDEYLVNALMLIPGIRAWPGLGEEGSKEKWDQLNPIQPLTYMFI